MKNSYFRGNNLLLLALIGVFSFNTGWLAAQSSGHGTDRLTSGQSLWNNRYIESPNGTYRLQQESNYIKFKKGSTTLWSQLGNTFQLLSNGNLVTWKWCTPNHCWPFDPSDQYQHWTSGTSGNSNSTLIIQDNGTLVLINSNHDRIWSAGTYPQRMDFKDWMSGFHDDTYLSELSIPGTHQSGATHNLLTPGNQVNLGKCQNTSIAEQLDAGVRFFDIRVKCTGNPQTFELWHGIVNQHQAYQNVLDAMVTFLRNHDQEVVIMRVKGENNNGCTNFNTTFNSYLNNTVPGTTRTYRSFFYNRNDVPKLGQARGKIVLLRTVGNISGMMSSGWANNTKKDTKSVTFRGLGSGDFVVQDFYEINSLLNTKLIEKGNVFGDRFDEAVNAYNPGNSNTNFNGVKTMYLNHSSGASAIGDTRPVANYMYNIVNGKLNGVSSRSRCGIIAMDFIDERYHLVWGIFPTYQKKKWDFVNKIIQTNYY